LTESPVAKISAPLPLDKDVAGVHADAGELYPVSDRTNLAECRHRVA
jgi:hypothetical protein